MFHSLPGLLIAVFLTLPAFAANVHLRDLHAKDEEYLRLTLPHLFDGGADQALLDDAIRVLIARGTYENVYVDRTTNGDFEIIGKPLRVIEEIRFNGVHDVSESALRDLMDFKIGDRFDRKRVVAFAEKMKNYYGEHGFFNTVIELNFQKAEDSNIRLVFDINEKSPCLIKGLTFNTPNTDLHTLLDSKYKSMLNTPLTTDAIRHLTQDLNILLIDHRYLTAEVVGPDAKYNMDKTEAYLQFEVHEPYRFEFYFTGNKFFSVADVYRALDLRNHERKNMDPSSEGVERLRREYIEKGFPSVHIEFKIKTPVGAPYLKRIYFTINEGPRVKIKGIEVQGRISRPNGYYENFILNNSSDLVSEGYYNRLALETGFKNLVTELRNQGFLRARTLSSRVEYNDAKDKVMVYLMLEEGPQTQIRALDFSGNKFFSSFELAEVTGLETNTPLRLTAFEESLDKLKNFYHDQGFMEMKLLNEGESIIQYNEKGTEARIKFQIYEGPRIRVHAISVEGNSVTKTKVIMTEAGFQLGEILTPQKIDEATRRLNNLHLFSRVDIRTLEEGTSASERTLVISVTEVYPGTLTFGGGIDNERNLTVRGYSGLSYNNIFGTARALSGRAEIRENVAVVKYLESELTVGYLEPFLFDTRTRGRINLTRKQYVYDYEQAESNFTEITIKNRVDFLTERDITPHTKLTYKVWSLESRKDFERYGRCLPDPDDPNQIFDPTRTTGPGCGGDILQVATIGPTLDIDYRDNPFLPTRGSFTRITLDYSNPNLGSSSGVEFYKLDAGFTKFTRLGSSRVIWANSVHGGYLSNTSKDAPVDRGVPSDYAFLLGGISTIRGFDISSPNERVPKDGDGQDASGGQIWRLGTTNEKLIKNDANYYLLKTELRFPIYGEFGGVIFYDGGAVRVTGYHFRRPYRDSVGFGFRYNTPVGPVAFDFGFKINPEGPDNTGQNAEAPFRFQFYIGTF